MITRERSSRARATFILHGGSEGLCSSLNPNGSAAAASGDSFIQFEKITLRRPEEAAASSKDMDSVRVQAIVFEVVDWETIGGSAHGGQKAICCMTDLAKSGVCTQDKFGVFMAIVKVDIGNSVLRLETKYASDPSKFNFLYDMARAEIETRTAKSSSSCTNALLWLTRLH